MTLDLRELIAGWDCPPGEICARTVVGQDGAELLQLRVDLGLMQMFPDGRPDGQRYRGLPSVLGYVRHELRLGRCDLAAEDWRELERELHQTNYRRLALASLVEDALGANEVESAKVHLRRALRDIDTSLECIRVLSAGRGDGIGSGSLALRPTLDFHRGRLSVQLRIVEQRYEEAVEEGERAVCRLSEMLEEMGLDEEQREQDPGVVFLRDLVLRLRQDYDLPLTLRERLEEAIENEDFESAARLRDELNNRGQTTSTGESNRDRG